MSNQGQNAGLTNKSMQVTLTPKAARQEDSSDAEEHQYQQKLDELSGLIQERRKKLLLLEAAIAKKRDEEEALITKAVQLTSGSTIMSISSLGTATHSAQEHSLEELESLRDALRSNLQTHANELKFHVNSRQVLCSDLIDTVCEAYYTEQKTWFAALIQDINLQSETVQIAWIGYGTQETLQKSQITILNSVDEELLHDNAVCLAVYPTNGMWYECQIEKKLKADEAEAFAGTDMRSSLVRFRVKFIQFDHKQVVPLDYIRITPDQVQLNVRKKLQEERMGSAQAQNGKEVGEFKFPEHLRVTKADTDKSKEQKRKKVKALKYLHKTQVQEQNHKLRQNEWLSFQKKTTHTSIFKSPDNIDGKVGVVNSGVQKTVSVQKPVVAMRPQSQIEFQYPIKRPRFN